MLLGGFECSCQRLADGRRLDLLASTRHLEFVDQDYGRLRSVGMTSCRDGVSWPALASATGSLELGRIAHMVRAAKRHGVTVMWDLLHFGWPDDVDVFAPSFPLRFARYAREFARWFSGETDDPLWVAPINEISFLAWAAGHAATLHPFRTGVAPELKLQLVRATLEAVSEIRAVARSARVLQPEPVIKVHPDPGKREAFIANESVECGQYEAWDMLLGKGAPSLGGHTGVIDLLGVNYYPFNQFTSSGTTVWRGDERYRPLSQLLLDVWHRYRKPMILSETGTEGEERVPWLSYVAEECIEALRHGCDLRGITLYPVVSHPGWADDRHCENGLWDYADDNGHRPIYEPLLREIERVRPLLLRARREMLERRARAEREADMPRSEA
jgi:hypothetical protein